MPPARSQSSEEGGALFADSAGQPWAGRTFDASTSGYEDDQGEEASGLVEAIRVFRAGDGLPRPPRSQAAVIEAFSSARLLVPLVAEAGQTAVDHYGRTVDKTQELAIVTVTAPDGRTALPVFTSVAAMASWNPAARPVPNEARRIALSAAAEGTDLLIIDPTSATEFVVRRPAVWAIAQGSPWASPFDTDTDTDTDTDAEIGGAPHGDRDSSPLLAEFRVAVLGEPAVVSLALVQGDPDARLAAPEVTVVLALAPGLDREALALLLARLQDRWAQSALIADRVDSLSIRLIAA
ncbi:SseB family protein [Subtercola sp. PAMC28395]|nr:SseB family protein [Subtercola sp. PAMC28395]QWT25381.1 SseB family protein [Subtercola sp. PAMC28395]